MTTDRQTPEGKPVQENGDRYPTFKFMIFLGAGLCGLGLALFCASVQIGWVLIDSHKEAGHKGAVYFTELTPIREDIKDLKQELREIRRLILPKGAAEGEKDQFNEIRRFADK